MYIKFWGTRGSIPSPLPPGVVKEKIRQALEGAAGLDLGDQAVIDRYMERLPFAVQHTVGGNTTCLEIRSGDQLLIIDAGSGLRPLGIEMMQQGFNQGHRQADFLFTHTHWDHIQGFPFFQPAFIPHNTFTIYSPFDDIEDRLIRQQHSEYFPVSLEYMSATLEFKQINNHGWQQLGNFRLKPMRLSHPGETYGYRIEDGTSCLVIATDSEYKRVEPEATKDYVEFFRDADMLIFDAQYSLTEALDRLDWGHSTALMGAELSYRANVKRLALFHHDPTSSDEQVLEAKEQAEAYLARRKDKQRHCDVLIAYDGLGLTI